MAEGRYVVRTASGRFIVKLASSEDDAIERFRKESKRNEVETIASVTNLDLNKK